MLKSRAAEGMEPFVAAVTEYEAAFNTSVSGNQKSWAHEIAAWSAQQRRKRASGGCVGKASIIEDYVQHEHARSSLSGISEFSSTMLA